MKNRRTIFTAALASLLGMAAFFSPAIALEPGHYGPGDESGHGVFVNCNTADECAVYWFNHLGPDRQVWLLGVPNCTRGADQVCDVSLTQPSAPRFNGMPGQVDIGESVGTLELTPMENGEIGADWNVITLRPDECLGQGNGQLLLEKCIGLDIWTRIAGNPRPARE